MNASTLAHYRRLIQSQTCFEGAARSLAEAADALGWELAGFQVDRNSPVAPRAANGEYLHLLLGWPAHYVEDWDAAGMGQHCPVGQRCFETMESLFWVASPRDGIWSGTPLLPQQREVLDHYGDLLAGGITVPVRRAAGQAGYVSWCSRRADTLHQRYERSFGAAFTLSHTFIYRAEQFAAAQAEAPALSEREIECLAWAARGKTEEEIARILFRSQATVHFHLRNAANKLDAGNRTHAVAIACSRGLILLD